MNRLIYVASISVRCLHLEWLWRELGGERFDVSFVLVCFRGRTPDLQRFLVDNGVPFVRIDCGLSPVSLVRAVARMVRHFRAERPEIVHTHMFLASATGMLAAFLARVPARIYTRHHHLRGRPRVVVWLDRLACAMATRVIALSRLAQADLLERDGVPRHKAELVHPGIDLERFRSVPPERVAAVRSKHGLRDRGPIVGVIGRWIESKGIQYVIPAFRRLLERHPTACLVLAHCRGSYRGEIERLLRELPEGHVVEIEFEQDVFALYEIFDVCVHVPIREELETFGLIYVEALAAGVPCVFTLSGVGREILEHRKNCWLVDHEDSDQIYEGLVTLLESPELRADLARAGPVSVDPAFGLRRMAEAMERLYAASLGTPPERDRVGSGALGTECHDHHA